MQYAKNTLFAALMLALPAAFVPATVSAQEEEPAEPLVCTAQADVESIVVGERAVLVTFQLSENIGTVVGIEAPESGVVVAAPEDLPRVEMANPDATPQPIEMSSEAENTVILWLNTANAQAGEHAFSLLSEEGRCSTTIIVEGGSA